MCRCLPPPRGNVVCPPLANRNSAYTYRIRNSSLNLLPFFSSTGDFFLLDNIGVGYPEVCVNPIRHFSCIVTSPPCDIGSGLPLRICPESCLAYNMLMATTTYDDFNRRIEALTDLVSLIPLRTLYLQFDCKNTDTYFFDYDDVMFSDQNCTNLFSAEFQGLLLTCVN